MQRDNLALVESLGPVEVSVPARRNPFCSRRPVRDEIFHISDRLINPPAFGDTGDNKPENQARILVYRYLHINNVKPNLLNCGQYLFRCSDKSGNYSKYASVVYTNDYVAVVKPK